MATFVHQIPNCFILGIITFSLLGSSSGHENQRGPTFFSEPPNKIEFTNDTGTIVTCSAQGHPPPVINWIQQDSNILRDVKGIRHTRPDGSLVFPPFAAEDFRQGVHDAVYRCAATNTIGSIISREVHVKAVVQRRYKVQVYDEFVVRGNTAVLRCQVPSFVHDYITFMWKRDDGTAITSTASRGGRYSILPTGELYIRGVTQADGQKSYSCQTRHRLTGDIVASASSGSLFVTEPHGTSSPKIIDFRPIASAKEGETIELACAATAFPPPAYRWYKEEDGRLSHLISNHRITQLDGSLILQFVSVQDSGRYVCSVNNTAGEDRSFTVLTVSAPLSVYVTPQRQVVDVGRSATFNCTVSGRPIRSLNWVKDQKPIEDYYGGGRFMLLARDVLHIPLVQREDKGMYQCFAFNDFESAQSSAELKLGDVAPTLLSTFANEAIRPGSSVSLRCTASGNPLPQVTWFLDDISIPDAVRFRVGDYVTSEGHVMSYVNITDTHVEDGGEYSCSASNTVASVRHTARLDIYGPPFVRPMPNISVVAGHTIVVKCPISGFPIENVFWMKDGEKLPMNHRQKVEKLGRLVIQDIQRSADEGFYACEAIGSDNKRAGGKMHMSVLVAPTIENAMLPEVLYAKESTKTKVMCSVSQGDPPIQIMWRKNGHAVTIDKDVTVQNLEDSSILMFRRISSKHSGNYTCFASNMAASVNRTTQIIVNVPPRWKVEPTNSFAVVGKTVVMHCSSDGYPSPRIYWKKAAGNLATDFRDVLSSYRRQVFDNGSLALQEVTEADGGHYLCQATNGIGAGLSKVILLTIHTPPKFETKFVSHTVTKGKDADLKCEAEGELPMRFDWEKDKQSLEPQNIKRLSAIEETGPQSAVSKLIIKSATRSDSALYTCTASNEFGNDQTNIQLVVQEPPSPPVDLSIKEKSSRTMTLAWSPTFSGNSPVMKYTVEHGNATAGKNEGHLKQTVVPGSEIMAIVRGLLPSSTYKFRVIAENALGVSEPSDFVTGTTEEEVPGGPPLEVNVQPTGSQSLKVTWKSPRKALQHGKIHGYYIGYKVADTDDQYQYKNVEATNGQELSYLTNLRRLTKYKIIVQAYNNIGAGPRSDELSATTLEAAPPTSPLLTLHSVTSSSLTVVWDRQLDDTGIREYILHYKTEGGGDKWKEQKLSTGGNQYTLEDLRCGTGYRLYMTATNSLGKGEPGDVITARTKGAAPVSPQKDNFIRVNSTFVTLHFGAWSSGGCPILYYSIHLRVQGQWKLVEDKVDAAQPNLDVRGLTPSREYTIRVSAHSDAGTTEAEYRFMTLNITTPDPVFKGYPPLYSQDSLPMPFYKNLTVLLPVVISVVVLLIVVITVIVCLRKQVDTGSISEDSRKVRNSEHMVLSEFPQKSLKDHDAYGGKSSYYSSPARKSLAMASSSQRGVPGDTSLTIKKYSGWS
ncbi:cell adhesion molecule Dscam1 isoform X2 [Parasteatoda tepidariorum]|uniref:cell adhesion molecule Dscam1 isoform X2 n=1 Tax=Parasteatoda tepidariorum TaxID=114398 RepID=UPI001C719FA4|nr:Down syndrome cell adhesion molecule-like protein Dscam2 isoform X2 [Parasteatoda tepidariorum]